MPVALRVSAGTGTQPTVRSVPLLTQRATMHGAAAFECGSAGLLTPRFCRPGADNPSNDRFRVVVWIREPASGATKVAHDIHMNPVQAGIVPVNRVTDPPPADGSRDRVSSVLPRFGASGAAEQPAFQAALFGFRP